MLPSKAMPRLFFASLLALGATSCSALSGLDGFELDETGGGGTTGDGGATASTGGGSEGGASTSSGGGGGVGGSGGEGGTGGPPPEPECGNGIIEQGEQCDAGSQTTYCSAECTVLGCDGPHDHLDEVSGHCYRYSDDDGVIGNWQQANGFCGNWGGHLLVLNGNAERAFIASLHGTLLYGNEYLWVGARDDDGDGSYQWVDGSNLPSGSPWWNAAPASNGCVAIVPANAGLEASANCEGTDLNTYHLHNACEREPEGSRP